MVYVLRVCVGCAFCVLVLWFFVVCVGLCVWCVVWSSFFFSSVVLFMRSLSLLSSLLSSLVQSALCVHTALTCLSVRVPVLWLILCWPNMLASCKKQLSRYYCASLVPLGKKWACICAGKWVLCLVVFGGVWWCLVVGMW